MLHLFLRSRRDSQSYDNDWIDDFRVRSIKTYDLVAQYCRAAMESHKPVRIHRRRYERIPAAVCSECDIKSITAEKGGFKVEFENWRSLNIEVDRRLQQGYYFADPSSYEKPDSEERVEDPYGDSNF
jgi:hypothetical protein